MTIPFYFYILKIENYDFRPDYNQIRGSMGKNQCCGSGSISTRSGSVSGSVYHQTKIVRKTLIPTVMRPLYEFVRENLSLINDVNVVSKRNKQQIREKKINFWLAS
jgi:hypothetical protein